MEAETTPTLFSALLAAQGEVDTLPKLGTNKHGGFNYTAADAVIRAARKLLFKHGLIWVRTGACVRPQTLAAGRIGDNRSHVGHVEISGVLMHASGELPLTAECPIVAMSATPHDKAWAASVTLGTGYLLLGALNQDRAEVADINAREDEQEPKCSSDAAREIISMCDALAARDGRDRGAVWSWVCGKAEIEKDGQDFPGPKLLYVAEAERVIAVMAVEMKPAPQNPSRGYLDLEGPRCSGRAEGLALGNVDRTNVLATLIKRDFDDVWGSVIRAAKIASVYTKGGPVTPTAAQLLTEDGQRIREMLDAKIDACQVEREPGDDGHEQEELGLSEKAP